jgi:hypothetical protein
MSEHPNDGTLSKIRVEQDEDGAIQCWWEQGDTNTIGLTEWFAIAINQYQPMFLTPSHTFWDIGVEVKIDMIGTFTITHRDDRRNIWYLERKESGAE